MQSLKLMQRCYYVLVKLNCVRFMHIKTCTNEGRSENFTGQVFWVIFHAIKNSPDVTAVMSHSFCTHTLPVTAEALVIS